MKNNKSLIALLVIAVLGLVGGTIAYFTTTSTFENLFKTSPYSMEVVETFESPSNWTPGTTTNKTIIATNKGDVEVAVRVSYTESWVDASNKPLPLKDLSGNFAAVINFASDLGTKWTKLTEGGVEYYYYNTKLGKNQSTSSFINSVTFNPNVAQLGVDNCVEDTSKHTTTCTTTTNGYGGGTYTLTVKVETVQFDSYKTAWNTNVNIK